MSILQPADSLRILALPSGGETALALRRSARARRILLRIDEATGEVELVLPRRAAIRDGLAFAEARADWIEDKLGGLPPAVPFRAGTVLPLIGAPLLLDRPLNGAKRTRRVGDRLEVPGAEPEFAARVKRWLIAEARREIGARAELLARRVERPVTRLSIRDPATRWGSCSATGALSFSWRLVLAPPRVLDYVIAHEVAHLREMNHGKRFWRLVADLVGEPKAERAWLTRNGGRLRRYGR
jgi:predicted metal-dependent hydrolase